ncbi:MAG: hypothetical protein U0Q18_30825 [Bryobacteraceae bacterium]
MGLKLSEYGLFRATDDTRAWPGATEAEVYEALGLRWFRLNCGASARSNSPRKTRLPELVELGDITAISTCTRPKQIARDIGRDG